MCRGGDCALQGSLQPRMAARMNPSRQLAGSPAIDIANHRGGRIAAKKPYHTAFQDRKFSLYNRRWQSDDRVAAADGPENRRECDHAGRTRREIVSDSPSTGYQRGQARQNIHGLEDHVRRAVPKGTLQVLAHLILDARATSVRSPPPSGSLSRRSTPAVTAARRAPPPRHAGNDLPLEPGWRILLLQIAAAVSATEVPCAPAADRAQSES